MINEMHTILGATGAVGQAVMQELQTRGLTYQGVSRSNGSGVANHVRADLLVGEESEAAIANSTYVYLCVGLPYDYQVWNEQWETIMQNVIAGCAKHRAKLIFLDNIYLYSSPLPVPFDERTAQHPSSKKGEVRKRTADMLLRAIEQNQVEALIGRSADFYGPGAVNSVFYLSFLDRMLKGKNPQLLTPGDVKHTYANVADVGRALVELALCPDCYQQVWHLPVGRPVTMEEVLRMVNAHMHSNFQIKVMPGVLKKVLPYFVPMLKEVSEMDYQFTREYRMSTKKFDARFPDFRVTPYDEGISQMVDYFQRA